MTMKKIFRKYPETVLIVLAAIFLGTVVAYFVWGAGAVAGDVNNALNANITTSPYAGFDLNGARALNLRGLVKPQQ